jgi:hypothetical protein
VSQVPEVLPPEEIVALLLRTIEEKTPARDIEFGYDEDNNLKWWAKVTLRSGRVRTAEVKVDDIRLGPVKALAEVGRELGLSVRIREPIHDEGAGP